MFSLVRVVPKLQMICSSSTFQRGSRSLLIFPFHFLLFPGYAFFSDINDQAIVQGRNYIFRKKPGVFVWVVILSPFLGNYLLHAVIAY